MESRRGSPACGCDLRRAASRRCHLLDEQRVARQLERLIAMRLQAECSPDTTHRRRTQPALFGHRARAPVRGIPRQRLQGLDYHALHLIISDLTWRSRPRLVQQPVTAVEQKPPPPLADRRARGAQFLSYSQVTLPGRGLQDDPRPQGKRLRSLRSPYPASPRRNSCSCSSDGSGICRV